MDKTVMPKVTFQVSNKISIKKESFYRTLQDKNNLEG